MYTNIKYSKGDSFHIQNNEYSSNGFYANQRVTIIDEADPRTVPGSSQALLCSITKPNSEDLLSQELLLGNAFITELLDKNVFQKL